MQNNLANFKLQDYVAILTPHFRRVRVKSPYGGWKVGTMAHPPKHPGLDGRSRDQNGEIRAKNSNTRVDTLRETYGGNFAQGARGDMHLGTLLDRTGANSLSDYLKNKK